MKSGNRQDLGQEIDCDRRAHKRKQKASNKRQYCMSLSGYKRGAVPAQEATFTKNARTNFGFGVLFFHTHISHQRENPRF